MYVYIDVLIGERYESRSINSCTQQRQLALSQSIEDMTPNVKELEIESRAEPGLGIFISILMSILTNESP